MLAILLEAVDAVDAVVAAGLGYHRRDVGVAFGLPGADFDYRFVGFVEVDKQEEITLVAIMLRIIVLLNLDAEGVAAAGSFLDIVV